MYVFDKNNIIKFWEWGVGRWGANDGKVILV